MAVGETGASTHFAAKLFLHRFLSEGWYSYRWRPSFRRRHAQQPDYTSQPVIPPLRRPFASTICASHRLAGRARANVCAPSRAVGAALRASATQEGKSRRKPLLSCPLLSSSAEACGFCPPGSSAGRQGRGVGGPEAGARTPGIRGGPSASHFKNEDTPSRWPV